MHVTTIVVAYRHILITARGEKGENKAIFPCLVISLH